MSTVNLADLKAEKAGKPINIRVLRKWVTNYRPGELSLIIVDRQGDAFQVTVDADDKDYIDSRLQLMNCYQLSDYICTPNLTFMKMIDSEISLRISSATQIHPLPHIDDIPIYYFNFHPYESLQTRYANKDLYTDYLGTVHLIQENHTIKGDLYVRVTLRDERNQDISLAIWKESLQTFNKAELYNAPPPAILAASSCKINISPYNGQLQLCTSDASYIYINPEITARLSLQQSQEGSITSTNIILHSRTEAEITLATLTAMPKESTTGKTYNCIATIADFDMKKGWFYSQCSRPTCLKALYLAETDTTIEWACTKHGVDSNPRHQFKVQARISDSTETTTVLIFDRAIQSLLNIQCSSLINEKGFKKQNIFPDPLLELIRQPLKFCLSKADNSRYPQNNFIASQITKTAPSSNTAPQTLNPSVKRTATNTGNEPTKKKLKGKQV